MSVAVYLSGRFSINAKKEKDWLKKSGCKYRCFSYAVVDPEGINYSKDVVKALEVCEKKKVSIMMDSGAHSIHVLARSSKSRGKKAATKQAVDINTLQKQMYKKYVQYCHENKGKWTFYVTLDFERKQEVIYKMQQQFKKDGLAPMPVVHGESNITKWIQKHADMGHKYIALGGASFHKGSINFYFDQAFELAEKLGLVYHGLAFTSLRYITGWPWKSVDSSTWSRISAFGQIAIPDFKKMAFFNVHVSEKECNVRTSYNTMTQFHKDKFKEMLASYGFDIDAMRDGSRGEEERHNWNGFLYSNLDIFMKDAKVDWDGLKGRRIIWEPLI